VISGEEKIKKIKVELKGSGVTDELVEHFADAILVLIGPSESDIRGYLEWRLGLVNKQKAMGWFAGGIRKITSGGEGEKYQVLFPNTIRAIY